LLVRHRERRVVVLHSRIQSGFFLRGENLLNGDYGNDDCRTSLISSWQRQWDSSLSGRWYHGLEPRVSLRACRWASGLPRWAVSTLSSMRLGNSTLNSRLHKCCLVPSSLCSCGEEETLVHFWLYCSRYRAEREILRVAFSRVLGPGVAFGVPRILAFQFSGQKLKIIRQAVMQYLISSRRFHLAP